MIAPATMPRDRRWSTRRTPARCIGQRHGRAADLVMVLRQPAFEEHVCGAPLHFQTQGKIGRWHQTPKNPILLEYYFLQLELEAAIAASIDHCNNHRYHESIGNLTPADVYVGRGETSLTDRRRINLQTIQNRRLNQQRQAA